MWNGPSFRGFKPILVSFQLFKDKEEILRKNNLLQKNTNMYVTEDFSRKVRKHREELIKFAISLRKMEPSARCSLQYDRLYVENEVYLYNEVEGRVERMLMRAGAEPGSCLVTPRPGGGGGGRSSRLGGGGARGRRAESRQQPHPPPQQQGEEEADTGAGAGRTNGGGDYAQESLTELEAELIQSGGFYCCCRSKMFRAWHKGLFTNVVLTNKLKKVF